MQCSSLQCVMNMSKTLLWLKCNFLLYVHNINKTLNVFLICPDSKLPKLTG